MHGAVVHAGLEVSAFLPREIDEIFNIAERQILEAVAIEILTQVQILKSSKWRSVCRRKRFVWHMIVQTDVPACLPIRSRIHLTPFWIFARECFRENL